MTTGSIAGPARSRQRGMPGDGRQQYSPAGDFVAQLESLRRGFPDLYRRLDPERVSAWRAQLAASAPAASDDFGSAEAGGRGESYVRAQVANVRARASGILRLVALVSGKSAERTTIVDLLGGDGLVRRVCGMSELADVEVMTCDASPHMVRTALANGFPALLQRAERQLFRSGSLDGVLLAYGTHHIPPRLRGTVAVEAYRVLAPGGTFVLHDFDIGSPVDTWFSTVVDPYSDTGHRYVHFTANEIHECFRRADFSDCEILRIDDPYVATAATPEGAELSMGEYLVDMYGLAKARKMLGGAGAARWAVEQAIRIFRYPDGRKTTMEHVPGGGGWRITIPRVAIVGVGRKP